MHVHEYRETRVSRLQDVASSAELATPALARLIASSDCTELTGHLHYRHCDVLTRSADLLIARPVATREACPISTLARDFLPKKPS